MEDRNALEWIVWILLVLGALHVGLGGLGVDLLGFLGNAMLIKVVSILVGLSALYHLYGEFAN